MSLRLDKLDRRILLELQANARMSNSDLASRVGLSESACLRRVKRLESDGIIESYTARISAPHVGLQLALLVRITLTSQTERDLSAFECAVRNVPEVTECILTTGGADYMLRVVARDSADFERLHGRVLTKLPCVARVESSLVLRQVVRPTALPIP